MNKKIGIFMVFVLLVGAVFLSACDQEAVGRNLKSVEGGGVNQNEMVDLGDEYDRSIIKLCCELGRGTIDCEGSCTSSSDCSGKEICVELLPVD